MHGLWLQVAAMTALSLHAATQDDPFSSQHGVPIVPAASVLSIDGRDIHPDSFGGGLPQTVETAQGRLTVHGGHITFRDAKGKGWTADDRLSESRMLDFSPGIAYVVDHSWLAWGFGDTDARVLRLDLRSGKWLPPIVFPDYTNLRCRVVGVSLCDGKVAILLSHGHGQEVPEYDLSLYDEATLHFLWSAKIKSSAPSDGPFFDMYPRSAETQTIGIKPLQWVNRNIVICPDEWGPIVSYSSLGTQEWRLDRPWEFVKSFTGPSVFKFSLSRSSQSGPSNFGRQETTDQTHVDPSIWGAVVAGPTWISDGLPGSPTGKFLLGVDRETRGGFPISESVVYELNDKGNAVAMTTLPQSPIVAPERVDHGAVIWACEEGSMIRIHPFQGPVGMEMMGPFDVKNKTSHIDWFAQQAPRFSAELMEACPASSRSGADAVAFSKGFAFRADEGWHAIDPTSRVVTFPLTLFNLATGVRTSAELNLKLSIPIKEPAVNAAATEKSFSAFEPDPIQIPDMQVFGSHLRVFINTGRGSGPSAYLDFLLPSGFR